MNKNFLEKVLPYFELLNDNAFDSCSYTNKQIFLGSVIQNRDGSLLTSFKLTLGDSFLSNDVLRDKRDHFLSFVSTLNERFTIFYTLSRIHSHSPYISMSDNMTGTAKIIEEKRQKYFKKDSNMINEVYISIVFTSIERNIGLSTISFNEYLETLQDFIIKLEKIQVNVKVLKKEDSLSFIKELLTFEKNNVLLPQNNIPLYSIFNTISIFPNTIPLLTEDGKRKNYIQCISFNALPLYTFPDMLSSLSAFPFELRLIYKFEPLGREKSDKTILDKKKQYKSSIFSLKDHMAAELKNEDISNSADAKLEGVVGMEECNEALDKIHRENTNIGYLTPIIVLHSDNEKDLEEKVYTVKKYMNKQGFFAKVENIGNTLLFITSLPGIKTEFRRLLVLSQNFTDILHLSSPFIGAPESSLLKKRLNSNVPLLYFKNLDGSTYYFSLSGKNAEKGHTFISGPTGSGKSVFLSLLVAAWQKYKNTRTIIIDRDLSSLNIVLSNDGVVYYPLGDNTSFHPLSLSNIKDSINFLKSVIASSNQNWNADIESDCYKTLDLLSRERETLTDFYFLLKGINRQSPLLTALLPYVNNGPYARLFDSKTDTLDKIPRITLIETNKILASSANTFDGVALPCMIHILLKLEKSFSDSISTLLIMDEAWKLLKNDVFRLYFEEWIKTLRKKNVDVVFSITNISDIVNTPIAETILSNVETRIFMNDKNAENAVQKHNYECLGLTHNEIQILKAAPDFSPLIINDGSLSVVDLCINNVLDALITTEEMKKEYLCSLEK